MKLRTTINGQDVEADVSPTSSLLELVRSRGLTGTKEGCRIGVCGVCTVLVDDLPVSACLYIAGCAEGADIWTIEGIAERDPALVDAFVACEGMQCGICTPGQVMAVAGAAREGLGRRRGDESPFTEAEIRRYLEGNLCRCTGYATIVTAARTYLDA